MRTIRKIEGYIYKVCAVCGREWNVSVMFRGSYYICPGCREKEKRLRRAWAERSPEGS